MVSGTELDRGSGTAGQSDYCLGVAAAVLRNAGTPICLRVPAAKALGRTCGRCNSHVRGVVRDHLPLPAMGLGGDRFPHIAFMHGCRPCVSLEKSPQKDAPGGQESEGRLGGLHTALSGRGVFGVGLPGILSPNAQSEFRRTIACTGAGGRAGFQWRVVTAGPVMRNVRLGARHVAMDAYLQLLCVDSLVAMDVQLTLQSGARHLACDSMRLGNILWVHDAVRLVPSRLCHG